MKFLKLKKLNSFGVSHIIIPLLAVVVIGGIGTYVLGVDHAQTPPVDKATIVKYSWSNCIYNNSYNPATYLTYTQWKAMGSPAPTVANFVNGSTVFHYTSSTSEIFVQPPNSTQCGDHKLTLAQWHAMGSRKPALVSKSFIEDGGASVYYSNFVAISHTQWQLWGSPTPSVISASCSIAGLPSTVSRGVSYQATAKISNTGALSISPAFVEASSKSDWAGDAGTAVHVGPILPGKSLTFEFNYVNGVSKSSSATYLFWGIRTESPSASNPTFSCSLQRTLP